jgi:hypothetical protein
VFLFEISIVKMTDSANRRRLSTATSHGGRDAFVIEGTGHAFAGTPRKDEARPEQAQGAV